MSFLLCPLGTVVLLRPHRPSEREKERERRKGRGLLVVERSCQSGHLVFTCKHTEKKGGGGKGRIWEG